MNQQFTDLDRQNMAEALRLACKPVAAPHPNPRVGCVIADGAEVIGEGCHERAGTAHAEVNAIRSLRGSAAQATMYVTLEPCASHGRTPPCVDAVIEAGVTRVVVGTRDPHPATDGEGIRRLRASGVDVQVGLLSGAVREINKGFYARHEIGRPWVTLKVASSIDGRIAMASGESAWITGVESREDVQRLRADSAAVLTGAGTVRTDDPRLNCRISGVDANLTRIVVDSRLSISTDANLFNDGGKVILATTSRHDAEKRRQLQKLAHVLPLSEDSGGGVDCAQLLNVLATEWEINNVLVEAGPTLVGTLLENQLVDEIIFYLAPSMLGSDSIGVANLPGLKRLSQKIRLRFCEFRKFGEDVRIRATVEHSKGAEV